MQRLEDMLRSDPDRACYGPQVVKYAAEQGAIDTLLLSDSLFRVQDADFRHRRQISSLVSFVKEGGGRVLRFSSLHGSGEKLDALTGIAALLRFPFPDLDELAEAAVANGTMDPLVVVDVTGTEKGAGKGSSSVTERT